MDATLLETLGKIAGVGGISLGLVVLVFRDVIRKNIFPSLTKAQAYKVIRQTVWLTFVLATIGLVSWVYVETQISRVDTQVGPDVEIEEDNPRLAQFALNPTKSTYTESDGPKFGASETWLTTYGLDPDYFGEVEEFRAIFSVSLENINHRDMLVTGVVYDVSEIGQVRSHGAGPLKSNQTYFHEIKYEVGPQRRQLVPPYRIPPKSVGALDLELYSTEARLGLTWIMKITFVTNMGNVSTEYFQLVLTGKGTGG